ncbi:MAG: 3-hydroxyacyl-CoA dehydrogenase [Leucobacter sp.]|nr:3-hydroxyacyl-CoA dehydrogenase [Leucobacter sp.]
MTTESAIRYDRDDHGIVTLTIDNPRGSVNVMDRLFERSLKAAVDRIYAEGDDVTGVILVSAKKTFFAGGDLEGLKKFRREDSAANGANIDAMKSDMRRLEQLGKPVVAALNGAALGGGLELALAAHHRVAADVRGSEIGLPEVGLGLLPGGGGVTRTVRMLGLQKALTEVILPATRFRVRDALAIGLIDEVVESIDELDGAARAFIAANPSPVKPWDVKGFKLPGGGPTSPAVAAMLPAMPATLRKQLKGAPMPAPRAAMAAAVEGAYVDFDTASLVETRYFVELANNQISKNMIEAMFFNLTAISRGASRPAGIERSRPTKVGIVGAGMMGAAIAYVTAKAGIDVVLKDVTVEGAEKGKDYSRGLEAKALARGHTTEAASAALLERITPTGDYADFADVDFVIEAVFEQPDVKKAVFAELEPVVRPDAVLGSNTSTLPITDLAEGVTRQSDFIGIHFFSPADKMKLVEIIRGQQTSDEVLARVFDYVIAIGKTPIVVNDSRGFFTSRVIGRFSDEAVAMLGEGISAASIEQAAMQAGYPVGPLQLTDELTLTLEKKIRDETRAAVEAEGGAWEPHSSEPVREKLLDLGRVGRKAGMGFYDYDENGHRTGLWPGLTELFGNGTTEIPFIDMQERMLFVEAIDSINCFDERVLTSVADANIGSIFGIGYPVWTGGVLQYVNQYEGGLKGFLARARELEEKYGSRFTPPQSLIERAETNEPYV